MSPRRDRAPEPDANVSAISAHSPRNLMHDDTPRRRSMRLLLVVIRLWVPMAIGVAGVALLLVALIVWMLNWLFRMSVRSNRDREQEELARDYFDRHGHWPGEEP